MSALLPQANVRRQAGRELAARFVLEGSIAVVDALQVGNGSAALGAAARLHSVAPALGDWSDVESALDEAGADGAGEFIASVGHCFEPRTAAPSNHRHQQELAHRRMFSRRVVGRNGTAGQVRL